MTTHGTQQQFRSFPTQVIDIPGGLVVKRGCIEFKIHGEGASDAVRLILSATRDRGATIKEICGLFSDGARQQVEQLIQQLLERKFLVLNGATHPTHTSQEPPLDIFYGQFGPHAESVFQRLKQVPLHILGVNMVSRHLTSSLLASGFEAFEVLDHPQHRNDRLFDQDGKLKLEAWPSSLNIPMNWTDGRATSFRGCVVVTSDFGGQQAMRYWNTVCLERKLPFLPILLKNLIGCIGPFILPGETPCYDCYLSRQRTHASDPETESLVDQAAFEGQSVAGFHPSMATVLGEIGAFELTRLYSGVLPSRKTGRLLEINLLESGMTERTVLKLPRCPSCSSFRSQSPRNLQKWPVNQTSASHVKKA